MAIQESTSLDTRGAIQYSPNPKKGILITYRWSRRISKRRRVAIFVAVHLGKESRQLLERIIGSVIRTPFFGLGINWSWLGGASKKANPPSLRDSHSLGRYARVVPGESDVSVPPERMHAAICLDKQHYKS